MHAPAIRTRRQAIRRYPALGFLVAAALLALALPSALRVPPNAPPTLAEVAPVPGQGNQVGDLARLGSGSSEGLGSGALPPPPEQAPPQPPSALKRCVGSPPRQTEDPLSPPCVAFFQGDNGGATWRGVTRDEVKVLQYLGACSGCENPMDGSKPITGDETPEELALKVYMRYFNARHQTYGRTVRLYAYHGTTATYNEPGWAQKIRAAIGEVDVRLRPFALMPHFNYDAAVYADEAGRRGMVGPSYLRQERDLYRRHAPLVYTYAPAVEDSAENAASFACRKLAGRPARFSGNPQDLGRKRVFGLVYDEESGERRATTLLALALERELKRQCGVTLAAKAPMSDPSVNPDAPSRAVLALRAEGVTTVIMSVLGPLFPPEAATAQGWYPEWFFPVQVTGGDDSTATARLLPQEQWRHAFGVSYDMRRGPTDQQPWYQAFKEVCPDCTVPGGGNTTRIYQSLSLLFYGIQSAGPRLTPQSLSKGLHAIPQRPSVDPYVPAAYFHAGDYAWIKDAKAMWWDPSGLPPGESQPGCYRLPEGGKRYRTGEWREGDADLFASGQPCQGPND